MIGLMPLKEFMLIKPVNHLGVWCVIVSKCQPKTCDDCYDLMQKATSSNNVAVVSVKGNVCKFFFWYISKDKVINIMKNYDLKEKSASLKYIIFFFFFLPIKYEQ